MDFTADKVALSKLLARAASAAAAKSPIPALTTVRICTSPNTVEAFGTDGFVGFVGLVDATVKAQGDVAVDAKRAADVARTLPSGLVRVRVVKDHVEFSAGKAKLKLPMLSAAECHPLPNKEGVAVVATVQGNVLSGMLERGGYAALPDDSRPFMSSTCLEFVEGGMDVVTTDGARLAHASANVAGAKPGSLLLSPRAVGEVKRLLGAEDVEVRSDGQTVFLCAATATFSARLVEASFPPWRKVMPSAHEQAINVDRAALLEAVKRVSAAAGDHGKTKSVDLSFGGGQVSVTGVGSTGGSGEDSVECECTLEMKMRVNPYLVEQALQSIVDDEARLELSGGMSPLVIKSQSGDATAVIMPLRE